jgi:hypothetical protein
MKIDFRDGIIPCGTQCLFEYHCGESDDSPDAELWYHSHSGVVVQRCVNPEYLDAAETMKARLEECGMPLAYEVLFSDGFRGCVMEDELLLTEADYERPNPPRRH